MAMASKVGSVLKLIGRRIPDAGSVMYHAADGVTDGGFVGKNRRHEMRKALHKQRMRASGMTDDIFGAKEVGGSQQNKYENDLPEPKA
jgi:hypothetical protein